MGSSDDENFMYVAYNISHYKINNTNKTFIKIN